MTRQKLYEIKSAAKKAPFTPTPQMIHSLVDSHLEAYDKIDGGHGFQLDQHKVRHEVREAFKDLRPAVEQLAHTATDSMHPEYGPYAVYIVDLIEEMLSEKRRPEFHQVWDYYRPRIDEEFGDD